MCAICSVAIASDAMMILFDDNEDNEDDDDDHHGKGVDVMSPADHIATAR